MKDDLADAGTTAIYNAFNTYQRRFQSITRRAGYRFESRDWRALQADGVRRLELYKLVADKAVDNIRRLLGDRLTDKSLWSAMRTAYSGLIADLDDWELAETFFNSITRRIFTTVGVDDQIEFVTTDFTDPPTRARELVYRVHEPGGELPDLIRKILYNTGFAGLFQDLERDVALAAGRVADHLFAMGLPPTPDRAEVVKRTLFRGKGAYVVGRLFSGRLRIPLVLCLLHPAEGIVADAVLLTEDSASILFSFTRSAFQVDADRPYDLVRFLKKLIPHKPVGELYSAVGFHKHGKTELYRDLLRQLTTCSRDRFEISRGKPGMVMVVFNISDYDLVFKLIRDTFGRPKKTTRKEVMEKYDLVFKHDRAGRLVEAQSFEHLEFHRRCFSEALLRELGEAAPKTVRIDEKHVIVEFAYVERRVTPLDVFLTEADSQAARAAVIDYGRAIKDLARSNIFPGDMLLKNFGVTRHGRVVFYDYDELCAITECNFRKIPQARRYEDELADQPWFHVEENDVFPEEFVRYLMLPDELREVFMAHHGDLFGVEFWRATRQRILDGEIIHIFPYSDHQKIQKDSRNPL